MTRATPTRSIAPADVGSPAATAALDEAAALLRAGRLVAFPTETVYGLGADATDPAAVARIFAAKGRPSTNPLIVHADGVAMARRCVAEWPADAEALADRYWPGPLTLVLPRSAIIPDVVTAGLGTVGVRVPAVAVARALITRVGRSLAAPSANRSTGISPTRADHVLKALDGRIDLVLDAGPTAVGLESTVLDLSGAVPTVLRPGPIGVEELAEALGRPVLGSGDREAGGPSRSPGQMAVHYAPGTPAVRVEPGEGLPSLPPAEELAVLAIGPAGPAPPARLCLRFAEPGAAAAALYDALHRCDESGATLVLILMPPDRPEWAALRDRLCRAARAPVAGPEAGRGPRR